jgi:hypothetical protein
VVRRRRYDDYLSHEPASSMPATTTARESVASAHQHANLAPLMAAAPQGRLSALQAGVLAQRLGNRGFGGLVARNARTEPAFSPREEFLALQEIMSSNTLAINNRAASGLSSGMQSAPSGNVGTSSSGAAPGGSGSSEIKAPSTSSGTSGGINVPSSALQPPSATPMPAVMPLSQLAARGSHGVASAAQAGALSALEANPVKDESQGEGGFKNPSLVSALGSGAAISHASIAAGATATGEARQKHRRRPRARFASGPGNLTHTSFVPAKPHSDLTNRRRTSLRAAQDQTEREGGEVTAQSGRVSAGAPSYANATLVHTPGASEVNASAQQQGQIAVSNTQPGGRESDLANVVRHPPVVEFEAGTPVTAQAGIRERMQSLLLGSITTLRNTFKDTADKTQEVVGKIAAGAVGVVNTILSRAKNVVEHIKATITNAYTTLQGILSRGASAIVTLVTRARTAVSRLIERATSAAGNIASWVRGQINAFKQIAASRMIALIASVRGTILNWLAVQAARTIGLIRQANESVRGLINLAFTLVFRRLMESREQLHRDLENQLGSSSPLPPRVKLPYRRYVREVATLQVLAQMGVTSQRIRGALMPLSTALTMAAVFVHTQFTGLVTSFRSAFAEPLRQADLVIPNASLQMSSGLDQVGGLTATVAGMSFSEWLQTEARMRLCQSGLAATALLFASV